MLIFFALIFGFIPYVCFYIIYREPTITEEERKINKCERLTKKELIGWWATAIISIILCFIIFISFLNSNARYYSNKWDKLINPKKEWYNNNYESKKMKEINNTIENYQKGH